VTRAVIEMRGITKQFPGVLANDSVHFRLLEGEIHALLGENGAGKSTLMSILSGLYKPDAGEIWLRGAKMNVIGSPRQALDLGIGMVHQHFRLVDSFSVTENVILGTISGKMSLKIKDYAGHLSGIAQQFGMKVDPYAKVWQLSIGEKQRVEILKLLYRGTDLLILDEPTAVLTPQETRDLFQTLRQMAATGKSIILITHKLQEVMEVADRITVLRKGRNAGTVAVKDTSEQELTRMMVERDVLFTTAGRAKLSEQPVLTVQDLCVPGDHGRLAVKNVSMDVHAGEILGIAGVAGNGQRELTEALTGLRPVSGGKILVDDVELTHKSTRDFIDARVSSIPEDRLGTGLVPGLDVYDNAILKDYRKPPVGKGILLNHRAVREKAEKMVDQFHVQVSDLQYPVRMLSGGNLQRLLLAREIMSHPRLVIASYPARGLDISATEAVYRMLLDLCNEGTAVLLISEDLDELITLADRIAVIYNGEIVGVVPIEDADIEDLGTMMVGGRREAVTE
jgi:ABC-type uncharacterized transport system ATPase subunit